MCTHASCNLSSPKWDKNVAFILPSPVPHNSFFVLPSVYYTWFFPLRSLLHSCTCIESHQSAIFIEDLYIFASDVNNSFSFLRSVLLIFASPSLPLLSSCSIVCREFERDRSINVCLCVSCKDVSRTMMSRK